MTSAFAQVKMELAHLTAKVSKERKNEEKKLKKKDRKEFIHELKANSLPVDFKCDQCDAKSESVLKLKSHERLHHMLTNSTQTEEDHKTKV